MGLLKTKIAHISLPSRNVRTSNGDQHETKIGDGTPTNRTDPITARSGHFESEIESGIIES